MRVWEKLAFKYNVKKSEPEKDRGCPDEHTTYGVSLCMMYCTEPCMVVAIIILINTRDKIKAMHGNEKYDRREKMRKFMKYSARQIDK